MIQRLLICAAIAVLGLGSARGDASNGAPWAIYGADHRQDLYEIQDPRILGWADSSVALFKFWDLKTSGHEIDFSGRPLGESEKLCPGERFFDEITSPYCSGVLIAQDLVLTAGHCVEHAIYCAGIRVAFGYELRAPGAKPARLNSGEVYRCSEVVALYNNPGGRDFAVIRLDRPVRGHEPLALRRGSPSPTGTPVLAIGYPSGLPKKVAGGASIRKLERGKFVSNIDSFKNNSGSPVLNLETGFVEGILISGDDDYVLDRQNSCNRAKVCPIDGCAGETATDISEVVRELGW